MPPLLPYASYADDVFAAYFASLTPVDAEFRTVFLFRRQIAAMPRFDY